MVALYAAINLIAAKDTGHRHLHTRLRMRSNGCTKSSAWPFCQTDQPAVVPAVGPGAVANGSDVAAGSTVLYAVQRSLAAAGPQSFDAAMSRKRSARVFYAERMNYAVIEARPGKDNVPL